MNTPLIECVPNFSEGRDENIIREITDAIASAEGVSLLNVDPGKATNRTVVTFAGHPEAVIEGAFRGIQAAARLIDMSKHKGEHPRMGATDVCPLIPLANITLEETAEYAKKLAQRVGEELKFPVYLYEAATSSPERKNLATIREGEYEGLEKKLRNPSWKPDFGPAEFKARHGATVIGARDFLVAYNVNLNTNSTRWANAIAFDIREKGRVKRVGHPLTGEIVKDENGDPVRIPGALKGVKAIGWYIEEFGTTQISINITDINATPIHKVFEETLARAQERGIRVTGSEIVGMVPKKVLLDAGYYFLEKQNRSLGVPEEEVIAIAVRSLGLNDIAPFDASEKIIEYKLASEGNFPLNSLTIKDFADKTGSEAPAPGGGSIAAYVGALGAALGQMVANLSANKRGWESKIGYYSEWAVKGQHIKADLLRLVDEDTKAFDRVMAAMKMGKDTPEDEKKQQEALEEANIGAAKVPLQVMQRAYDAFEVLRKMAETGNPASISDAGVGALCARTAVHGAWYNVKINVGGIENESTRTELMQRADELLENARKAEAEVLEKVSAVLEKQK